MFSRVEFNVLCLKLDATAKFTLKRANFNGYKLDVGY
jgi:hypothetical protein